MAKEIKKDFAKSDKKEFSKAPKKDFAGSDKTAAPKTTKKDFVSPAKKEFAKSNKRALGNSVKKDNDKAEVPKRLKKDGEPVKNQAPYFPKKYINVYIGLGSNMGKRKDHIKTAHEMISKYVGQIVKKSFVYETAPMGNTDQGAFLNQVIMVNTTMDPRTLLESVTQIEKEMGRERKEKWGPRTIDIDILLYGKRIIRDKGLEIPHPEMHKRAFVLIPLMDIDVAGELEHPVLKRPLDELFMEIKEEIEMVRLEYMI